MNNNTLAAKIKAVNRVNKVAIEVFPVISKAFKNYVGKQIVKVDGQFLKKVAACLPVYHHNGPFQVIRHYMGNALTYTVKVSEHIDGSCGCLYEQHTLYIGTIEGGVLVSLFDQPKDCRTDYTIEDILSLRHILDEAKKAVNAARNDLHPFGEYD